MSELLLISILVSVICLGSGFDVTKKDRKIAKCRKLEQFLIFCKKKYVTKTSFFVPSFLNGLLKLILFAFQSSNTTQGLGRVSWTVVSQR